MRRVLGRYDVGLWEGRANVSTDPVRANVGVNIIRTGCAQSKDLNLPRKELYGPGLSAAFFICFPVVDSRLAIGRKGC
jgi:hypothetical protein